ncbi:MAG: histidinol dehydrogenase [Spirosomataceae bacterium]
MQILENPPREVWKELVKRPAFQGEELEVRVQAILQRVKNEGDSAIFDLMEQFEGHRPSHLEVPTSVWKSAADDLDPKLKQAIDQAYENIHRFHSAQISSIEKIETMPGVVCWRKSVPIQKVGIYIPGGTAPLFSTVLMLGVPAQIAGCPEVVLCSPSQHPAIYYAASKVGVTRVFRVGGAQAIGAMAFGTNSVPQVSKIFGPGNQYVTLAKQLVNKDGIAIDMPAGPSEVAVLADHSAHPAFVAADLLSQAEHGSDSQVVLISTDRSLIDQVMKEVQQQLESLPRKELAAASLENSKAIWFSDLHTGIDWLNEYAAEHLILAMDKPEGVLDRITDAGSVFVGHYTPESCGDYASGTNHTLPTSGFAKAYSGVSLDSFVKKITFQEITPQGLHQVGPIVETMATAESLTAHQRAVRVRLDSLTS